MKSYCYIFMQGKNFVIILPRVLWLKGIKLLYLWGVRLRLSIRQQKVSGIVLIIIGSRLLLRVFTPITIKVMVSIYACLSSTRYLGKHMADTTYFDRHHIHHTYQYPLGHSCHNDHLYLGRYSCPCQDLCSLVSV